MAQRKTSTNHINNANHEKHIRSSTESCQYCHPMQSFRNSSDFVKHLRDSHCTKEGGSYVCRYGNNAVCSTLPLDGVSDKDYESHVLKYHVNVVKEVPEEWSVYLAAQNLSAVLNDPSRGKQTNLFTKKWGDYFVEKVKIEKSSLLEDVQWNDFDPYLKRIGKRFKRHQRLAHLNYDPNTSEPHFVSIGNLEDVPEIFLRSEMNLSDSSTFNLVFPGVGDKSDESRSSARLLQEKLSHYLDIVEVRIAKQVSMKSSVFFHAMTSQDTIMEEMSLASANVKSLRKELSTLKLNLVDNSLKIMQLTKKKQNMQNVLDKLKLMSTVHKTQPMLQLLLGTQDYVAALDLISTTQEILQQELVGILCFKHLPMQLDEMEKLIDKMLTTEFERYSTTDLNRLLHNSNTTNGSDTTSLDTEAEDLEKVVAEDKLVSIVMGLLRKKNFSFIDMYKEEAIVTIKAFLKQLVIEVIATSDVEICLTGAGEEAQSLSISEWIDLLERATIALLEILNRIKSAAVVMLTTADAAAGKCGMNLNFFDSEAFLSETDHQMVEDRLCEMINSVCNYCHERCANLVSNQSLEKSIATPVEIQKLNEIVEHFSNGCGEISEVRTAPLQMAVKTQASRFANQFHSERKNKISLILDSEKWKQVDIPSEFQKIIDKIAENEFICSKTESFNSAVNGTSQANPVLLVEGKPYALVGAALTLVQMMNDYCNCASQLPIVAQYQSRNIVDLMRIFNSRSCQLVFGAGALRVAGLKTITIGNLALVSRAIQLVLWLLPKVKAHFIKLDSTSEREFATIEKDFTSHMREIEAKILVIVSGLVGNQLKTWDARPPVPSQAFRNISKHFVKLHEAVSPILPEPQIQEIYRTVHKNFKDKLREQLLKYNIVNNGGPQHGVVTSELTFYMETLRTIKALPAEELGANDETLEDIWIK